MSEKIKFIAAHLEKADSFSDLCDRFSISRKTGYKWVERYEAGGVEGLHDKSRARLKHENAVPQSLVEELLALRRKHPRWGPKKLHVVLQRRRPSLKLPVPSTIGEILKRNGMIKARRRRVRSSPFGEKLGGYDHSNSIWCADFKGHFAVGEERCHPLTVSDGYSRYLLACKGLSRPLHANVQRAFEQIFREYGMPDSIRTDNGPPFSTLAPGGLSRLAVWWIRLGIKPERIMPGRPDQNGRHERMHRTLKAETAKPPCRTMRSQQESFNEFRMEFNQVRPHEALGQRVPAELYKASIRQFPKILPEPEYPDHFKIQRAYPNGVVSCNYTQWYLSHCLANELIGLEEVADGRWKAFFGTVPLGIIDAKGTENRGHRQFGRLIRIDGAVTRRKKYGT